MKEQAGAYLDKAREVLGQAEAILRIGLNEPAGRTAYLAGLHAAQALIFETTGRVYKSHSGVHGEFGRLIKDDPRFDQELRGFLGHAYSLKAIADYETGPASHVSAERAGEAVETARRLIDCVAGVLA